MTPHSRTDRIWSFLLVLFFIAICACLSANASAQTAPALTFAMSASSTDGSTVTPVLTWSTSPAAASCAASGDWTGSKAATGTETLAAVSASKAYTLTCTWPGDTKAVVTWTAPTTNADGSTLTDLAGFRILYGKSSSALDQSVYLQDPKAASWTSPDLAAGTWFFGVRAFNALGLESATSTPLAQKVITAATNQARTLTLGFKLPAAPTSVVAK